MRRFMLSSVGLAVALLALPVGTHTAQAQVYTYTPGFGNPYIGQYWSNGYDPRFSYTLPGYSVYAPGAVYGTFYGGPVYGYGYGYRPYGYGYGPHYHGYRHRHWRHY